MAPNKRGGPLKAPLKDSRDNVIVPDAEVAARGRGTCEEEGSDSYDGSWAAELRVFFTGARGRAAAARPHAQPPAARAPCACRGQHVPPCSCMGRPCIPPLPTSAGLMFLTRLPVPAGTDHHPAYLMRSTAVRRRALVWRRDVGMQAARHARHAARFQCASTHACLHACMLLQRCTTAPWPRHGHSSSSRRPCLVPPPAVLPPDWCRGRPVGRCLLQRGSGAVAAQHRGGGGDPRDRVAYRREPGQVQALGAAAAGAVPRVRLPDSRACAYIGRQACCDSPHHALRSAM